jgi:peptide/nickel transport system ATP-binding protein
MEVGGNREIFAPPYHPYTHALLNAVPTVTAVRSRSARRTHERATEGAACAFAGRCPWQLGSLCVEQPPPWREAGDGLRIRCHLRLDELPAGNGLPAAPRTAQPAATGSDP